MSLAGDVRIAVSGPDAAPDRALLAAYFGPGAPGLTPPAWDGRAATQLAQNKLSPRPWIAPLEPARGASDGAAAARDAEQQNRHRRWRERLAWAVALVEGTDVEYVVIKALRSPFAVMSDVDFLVPEPRALARVAGALERAGFALYRFRPIAHPLKVLAVLGDTHSVDLYPDAMWVRKHVLDGPGVLARRRRGLVRGVPTWLPCAADDLTLVATHAFARGDFTLAELDHGAHLAAGEPIDWARVLDAAAGFGTQDALYAYLRLLNAILTALARPSAVPPAVLATLAGAPATRPVSRWLDAIEPDLRFRLRVPLLLGTLRSALYHLPAVRGRLPAKELALDGATHLHTAVTHLLGRD